MVASCGAQAGESRMHGGPYALSCNRLAGDPASSTNTCGTLAYVNVSSSRRRAEAARARRPTNHVAAILQHLVARISQQTQSS